MSCWRSKFIPWPLFFLFQVRAHFRGFLVPLLNALGVRELHSLYMASYGHYVLKSEKKEPYWSPLCS